MSAATSAITATATRQSVLPGLVAGTWTIDPAHSTVGFAIRHLMGKVRGTFTDFSGQIVINTDPARSITTATIGLSSVHTGNAVRDKHLCSADFFNVETSPTMSFASTGLHRHGDCWMLTGDLTIRGITRPVDLEVEFLGVDPTGTQGETRIGVAARATISRRAFGVSFGLATNGSKTIISDSVNINLDIEAVLHA